MKCEHCNQNEATFFYEENINGVKRSAKLCAECAAKLQGQEPLPHQTFGGFGNHLLDGLFGFSGSPTLAPQKTCPDCKATWNDLLKTGKAVCPTCYTTFRAELLPSLRSLHGGNLTHTGRAPADRRAVQEKKEKLETLKKQLAEAIAAEKFEEAATLRDEIRGLEQK
ncbi:MAG: UvrB/UvrC motif-containing protein [Clostridia bacterium]|nr:UvrB/UvrC motif-containing protein [Clostridia bacterium]